LNPNGELLPPKNKNDKDKLTLILDLDETLIHSSFIAIPNSDFKFLIDVEFNRLEVYVCIRPGAERFIKAVAPHFELVVFTAASKSYADHILTRIDPENNIKYRLYRDSCSFFSGVYVKDLSKLGRELQTIIIVDNSPASYMLQPYNAIAIIDWIDDQFDHELDTILEFLLKNKEADNVYQILVQ